MDIAEMHVAFRQYAQQMGMQNVRAILPEQIDILLNQSIMDTINQLIRENIGVTNDRVVTDNSKIGQINAFRTLYKVKEVGINFESSYIKTTTTVTTAAGGTITNVVRELVNAKGTDSESTSGNVTTTITYSNAVSASFSYDVGDRLIGLIKHTNPIPDNEDPIFGRYMFLVDISINYTATTGTETITTPWFPVRIIDSAYLSDSLNDFILKNRFRSPIGCVYSEDTLELYIDKFDKSSATPQIVQGGTTLVPNKLRIDVIANPAVVKYYADINDASTGVSCNLPENMHGDIVKHAVDLYRIALTGSLQSQQEAEQNQQRENVRNNYRNEGN